MPDGSENQMRNIDVSWARMSRATNLREVGVAQRSGVRGDGEVGRVLPCLYLPSSGRNVRSGGGSGSRRFNTMGQRGW